MEQKLKVFIKPVVLKEEKYETASAEHCHIRQRLNAARPVRRLAA